MDAAAKFPVLVVDDRRRYQRVPGKFNAALDAAYEVIRAHKIEEIPLSGKRSENEGSHGKPAEGCVLLCGDAQRVGPQASIFVRTEEARGRIRHARHQTQPHPEHGQEIR